MTSRKKRAERGRVWAQQWADKHGPACPNCGENGRHFAPPGFGSPGMYICKPKDEIGTPVVLTRTCPLCGLDIAISGHLQGADSGFSFTSDEDGTKTAWDHQALHDAEEEVGPIDPDRPAS